MCTDGRQRRSSRSGDGSSCGNLAVDEAVNDGIWMDWCYLKRVSGVSSELTQQLHMYALFDS